MATAIIVRRRSVQRRQPAQAGFSLIEVVISMAILTVGMVSLLGVFGLAMASTQTSQQDLIAKQLANEAYESVVTARNTSEITWDQINNVGSSYCSTGGTCGIFLTNYQPIYFAGLDGIFGTVDDVNAGEEYLTDPGVDGLYNTADDVQIPLTNYQRQIAIGPVRDSSNNIIASLRSVTITVLYSTAQNQTQRTYTVNSFISEYQ